MSDHRWVVEGDDVTPRWLQTPLMAISLPIIRNRRLHNISGAE